MTYQSLIGKQAPAFSLPNYTGETYAFTPGEKGVPTAIFFYPESGTYGCTKEACQFRDAIAEKDVFKPGKVNILGISIDPVDKQKQFVEKNKLTYPVLSDTKKDAVKAYGIGKGMLGLAAVARVTFIIDKKGVVRDALDATMNFGAHHKFVGKWLEKLEKEDEVAPTPTTTAAATTTETAEAPETLATPQAAETS